MSLCSTKALHPAQRCEWSSFGYSPQQVYPNGLRPLSGARRRLAGSVEPAPSLGCVHAYFKENCSALADFTEPQSKLDEEEKEIIQKKSQKSPIEGTKTLFGLLRIIVSNERLQIKLNTGAIPRRKTNFNPNF
jgi:hypothetical protein